MSPKRMSVQQFVKQGQGAQDAVDQILEPESIAAQEPGPPGPIPPDEYREIYVSDLVPSPLQPRDRARIAGPRFEELVASVQAKGVREPIIVRPHPDPEQSKVGTCEIVAGERRVLAAREAKLAMVPAIVRQLTDVEVLEEQLIENLQREDLDPIEQARGYQGLLEQTDPSGNPYTQERLAKRLGKSQSEISQRLGLLNLPEPIQEQVAAGSRAPSDTKRELSPSHARVLVPFSGYPWILEAIQGYIQQQGLPPAKEFPAFVEGVIFGDWHDKEGKKFPVMARTLSEGQFFGSGRHLEFNPRAKSLPRDWTQIPTFAAQHPAAPGPGPCTDCPHIRVLRGGSWADEEDKGKYCLLSTCWEGKQKAHRAADRKGEGTTPAQVEKIQDFKEDPNRINLGATKREDFMLLTRGKDNRIESYNWKQQAPIFEVQKTCRTNCPHKAPDGGRAYRQGYKIEKGKVLELGALCLHPEHFKQLQKQHAVKVFQDWKQGALARFKGLAKQAAKGLDSEDLVRLLLSHLDQDLECSEQLGHILGWQQTRVSMVEFFQQVFGIQDRGMQRKTLAKRTRKELETWVKFALLCRKADKLSPRFRG